MSGRLTLVSDDGIFVEVLALVGVGVGVAGLRCRRQALDPALGPGGGGEGAICAAGQIPAILGGGHARVGVGQTALERDGLVHGDQAGLVVLKEIYNTNILHIGL